jgi:hypothetical protein
MIQVTRTAQWAPAGSQTAHHLRLVPNADLPHLNSGSKLPNQILHQFPEINSSFRCKKNDGLAAVKSPFHANKAHGQLPFFDFLVAKLVNPLLQFTGPDVFLNFLFSRETKNLLKRASGGILRAALRFRADIPDGRPFVGDHQDFVPFFEHKVPRVKVIDFSMVLKLNSDDFAHFITISLTSKSNYLMASRELNSGPLISVFPVALQL